MCVDVIDLNKACPNDLYPFPRINLLVDSTTGHELLSTMNASFRYNHIKIDKPYMEATSFVVDQGMYYYKGMPFELKNSWATYQRLVNQTFNEKIGDTIKVYVDEWLSRAEKRRVT